MSGFPGGQRRLIFTGNTNTNLYNKYTNAGIGATSSAVRRAKLRRAMSNPGTFDSATGVYNFDGQPCCSPELFRKNKGYYGNDLNNGEGGDTPDPPVNPDDPLNPDTGEPQTDVEGFQIWYDGSDKDYYQPSSIASDPTTNTPITQWNDKSGQAHNASPPGGATVRPEYSYDPSLNGLSYVAFDGTNDCLNLNLTGAGDWLANQQNLVVFMVAAPNSITPGPFTLLSTEQNDINFKITDSSFNFAFGSDASAVDISGGASTNPFLATLRFRGGESTNEDKFQFRLNTGGSGEMQNQTLQFTGTWSGATSIGPNPGSLGFGCQAGIPEFDFFNGYIAEILIYTVNLDLSGVEAVENYLNNKWFNVPIP